MLTFDSLSRRQFLGLLGSAAAVAGLGLAGCGSTSEEAPAADSGAASLTGSIVCSGATSFQPLVEAAANKFMDANPDVSISITGGGSGQGLSDIKDGTAQIGRSDVFAETKLEAADVEKLVDNQVAIVGMGPIVNSGVDVDDLTVDQLKGIFTGAITDWGEVGGTAGTIQVINRKAGSGTRATFEDAVLAGETVPDSFRPVAEEDSSGTVVAKVSQTQGAISYLAFSYYDESKFKALSVDGVAPTAANVESGDFKIWSYEHMYTSVDADDATKAFIEYMLSDEVQGSLVEDEGFIPLTGMEVQKDAEGKVSKK
ncbi:phosphate ABC transporter substrate-binding protein [Thermophilibacter immobilis]|uniref:Phosphate ABC transporter substrate-binding protein n=1 Tax=Thermophilibacter immobilis TaxID=2779519 RepID=A0A7S7RU38_9ACTN|nr:phosphate ABC transporter substrate-binding protein [Thermophilibacter immobilis]QOY60032.1 phosphate ABC transporter substrate-binding protein [Thermophilibacter immobilis]